MIKTLGTKLPVVLIIFMLVSYSCSKIHKQSADNKNEDYISLYKQAQSYQFKGQLDSALIYYDKADSAAPNTAVVIHERGLLKSNMRRYDDAIIDLNKSIDLTTDENRKQIRFCNRGLVYMEMKKMVEACNDWRRAGRAGKVYVEKYCN